MGDRKKAEAGNNGVADSTAEHEATVQKGYEAARKPVRQGDGDPGTEPVDGTARPAEPEEAASEN